MQTKGYIFEEEIASPENQNVAGRLSMLAVYGDDSPFSGILGLSPDDDSNGPLFVQELYEQGALDSQEFGIQLAPYSLGNSWIEFGQCPQEEDWISHRIAGSFHWQLKLN